MLEEEQRSRNAQRDALQASARRCAVLSCQLNSQVEVLDKRAKTQAQLQEIVERLAELSNANNANTTLQAAKKESELDLDLKVLHVLCVVVSIAL